MSTKERQAALVETLRAWQAIEIRSGAQSSEIAERTRNPVLRLVMDILRRDSAMHHRVQHFIVEAMRREAATLTAQDLEQVWSAIEAHLADERETARLAAAARDALAGTSHVVPRYLLAYLEDDERKHDRLLAGLDLIKRGLYRSAR